MTHAQAAGLRVFRRKRGQGKTKFLVNWLLRAPDDEIRILLSHDRHEAHRLLRLAYDRDLIPKRLSTWQFGAWTEAREAGYLSAVRHFNRDKRIVYGVDNLDLILHDALGIKGGGVGVVTMTIPERVS